MGVQGAVVPKKCSALSLPASALGEREGGRRGRKGKKEGREGGRRSLSPQSHLFDHPL